MKPLGLLYYADTEFTGRKMDMLAADYQLSNDAAAAKKRQKKKGKKKQDEGDPAFHFIAFVPVDGTLWKLDGLEHQPNKLGMIESKPRV